MCGFLRFLNLFKMHDWASEPLCVDLEAIVVNTPATTTGRDKGQTLVSGGVGSVGSVQDDGATPFD